jgi:hypothetical protein
VHRADVRLDARRELHGRRARANDSDALSPQIVVVIPRRRMEDGALEAIEPRDIGDGGHAQSTHPAHEHVGGERSSRGLEAPVAGVCVPGRPAHLVAEADEGHDAEVPGAAAEVLLDLALAGVEAGPVRIGRERKRVEDRWDVALTSGVGVVAPRPTDVIGLLEDDEVLDPLLSEANRHAEPREAAADDRDPDVLVAHRARA